MGKNKLKMKTSSQSFMKAMAVCMGAASLLAVVFELFWYLSFDPGRIDPLFCLLATFFFVLSYNFYLWSD